MRERTAILTLTVVTVFFCGCTPKATTSLSQPAATPDNSANSLDWPGTYTGVVPCADCEGINRDLHQPGPGPQVRRQDQIPGQGRQSLRTGGDLHLERTRECNHAQGDSRWSRSVSSRRERPCPARQRREQDHGRPGRQVRPGEDCRCGDCRRSGSPLRPCQVEAHGDRREAGAGHG